MKKLHSSNGGFSLVELIVAVVILGIITVPLLHTLLTGAQTAKKSADASDATAAAQSLLELVRAKGASGVFENVGLVGAAEPRSLDDYEDIIGGESTVGKKFGVISGYNIGTRQYDVLLKIDSTLADNSTQLSKSSPMDITLNMRFADGRARNDFREKFKEPIYAVDENGAYVLDDDGQKIIVDYDYSKIDEDELERTGIAISAARTDAGAGKHSYTITSTFSYGAKNGSGKSFAVSYSSDAQLNNISPTEYGQAAFSVYLIYDAFVKLDNDGTADGDDGINKSDKIMITNPYYTDEDFNVFLVNASSEEQPTAFTTQVQYKSQRYSDGETCARVFSNLPAAVMNYYPYQAETMREKIATTGALVETATEQRRFIVSVSLFPAGSLNPTSKPTEGEPARSPLLSLDAEMLK